MPIVPWQTGIWQCQQCRQVLGVVDYAGRLWITTAAIRTAEVCTNAVIVVCACGRRNVYWSSGEKP